MSNSYISLKEVTIVIKTPTTVTSCYLLGRLAVLIIHLTWRVYKSSFENLEDELNTDRGNKMKKANIRFRKSYSNIRMECEYSNIRIFVDILTKESCQSLLVIFFSFLNEIIDHFSYLCVLLNYGRLRYIENVSITGNDQVGTLPLKAKIARIKKLQTFKNALLSVLVLALQTLNIFRKLLQTYTTGT